MENGKMGPFIRRLRKERGMTQKELAAALGVTDKAVSKWELGASLPDVALLLPLAERLGVSATELLAGVRAPEAPSQTPEAAAPRDTAGDLLSYARRTASQRWEKLRLWLFAGLSGSFLLSAAVCWICDMALNRELTWSLIVCVSLALAWVVLLPLLTLRRGPVPGALAALSAAILPYLYILGDLLGDPRVFRFGLPIAPAAAVYLWGVYAVCRRHRRRRWHAAGDILLLTAMLNFTVDIAVYLLAPNELLWGGPLMTLALSAACFLTDYVLRRLRETPET